MGKILAVIIILPVLLIVSMLITLLKTHIVLDIAQLFEVGFLTALSFKVMFGFLYVINLLWLSLAYNVAEKKQVEQDSVIKTLGAGFGSMLGLVIALVISWGLAYVAHGLFF